MYDVICTISLCFVITLAALIWYPIFALNKGLINKENQTSIEELLQRNSRTILMCFLVYICMITTIVMYRGL